MCHILLFSCSISPLFNRKSFALLFCFACISMIYSFWLLGIYVLSFLLKLLILNMFCICILGHLCFTSSPQTSNFKYVLHLSSGRLCFIISFPISIFKYVLHQSLGHLFLVIFSFSSTFSVFSFLFLFLSVCVSIVICLYFYCYLLVFLWYFAACTSAGIQRVLRPSYSLYHSRHTKCTTAVVHSPKAHTLCTISP